jgi:hypothetical protein
MHKGMSNHKKKCACENLRDDKKRCGARIALGNKRLRNQAYPRLSSPGPILKSSKGRVSFRHFQNRREFAMLDSRPCKVSSAEQLDAEIQDIFWLDKIERGDEISGTLNVYYSNESVKLARRIVALVDRGVVIAWHKIL